MAEDEKPTTVKPPTGKSLDPDTQRLIDRAARTGHAAEFVGLASFEGARQVNIADILDIELVLAEYREAKGAHGEFILMHLIHPNTGEHLATSTGGVVVVRKVRELTEKGKIPCLVTILKPADYYDIV